MKTIRQIAEEIGVSKQAIFYRISKPPLSKTKGVLTVSLDGEKLIKSEFSDDCQSVIDKKSSKENKSLDNEILLLHDIVDTLKEQLKIKDRQIEKLIASINNRSGNNSKAWWNNEIRPPIKRLMEYQINQIKNSESEK